MVELTWGSEWRVRRRFLVRVEKRLLVSYARRQFGAAKDAVAVINVVSLVMTS